jgi:hypothetical protein
MKKLVICPKITSILRKVPCVHTPSLQRKEIQSRTKERLFSPCVQDQYENIHQVGTLPVNNYIYKFIYLKYFYIYLLYIYICLLWIFMIYFYNKFRFTKYQYFVENIYNFK